MTTATDLGTTGAVVVAAGRGERFGMPKAQLELDGVPLWRRGEMLFTSSGIDRVVVVGDVPRGVPGGVRRRDSVANGLRHLTDVDYVLVHDAARPLATPALVERVVGRLRIGDVDAVIPVIPVADTVKRVDGDRVVATLDRTNLVGVQTPQGFRRSILVQAHDEHPDLDATDDAGLVEMLGGVVVVVDGDPDNFKITWPGDIARAETLLGRRSNA